MEFFEMTEKEYNNYWEKHPLKTFLSAVEIGKLRKKRAWKVNYVGLKKNNIIYAATMLLSHKNKLNKYEFYSPRGYLIDFNNDNLVKEFTNKIKNYIKKKKGYVLRIDPYILNKERDINGKLVENGFDNSKVISTLKQLGFKKVPQNKTEQVTWMFTLNLKNKTQDQIFSEMKPNTRNIIKKIEKQGIQIKELKYNELNEFYDILNETSKRKNFKARNITYYQNMYKLFSPKKQVKYLITQLDINKYIKYLETEEKTIKNKLNQTNIKETRKKELLKELDNIEIKIDKSKQLKKESKTDIINLSASMFILIHPEIIYLSSGNYQEYMNFNSQYLLQWELIKYGIKNNYDKYNFYGIPEDFKTNNKNYGIYEFKKGFNGCVEELIGEYELPISSYYYLNKIIKH